MAVPSLLSVSVALTDSTGETDDETGATGATEATGAAAVSTLAPVATLTTSAGFFVSTGATESTGFAAVSCSGRVSSCVSGSSSGWTATASAVAAPPPPPADMLVAVRTDPPPPADPTEPLAVLAAAPAAPPTTMAGVNRRIGVAVCVRLELSPSAASATSIPVAMSETRNLPSRSGSMVCPKMKRTLSSSCLRISSTAPCTSKAPMSSPPEMLSRMLFAPEIEMPSSSGFSSAASTAYCERCSPSPSPVPMTALPISLMTVLTSLKSRLMYPRLVTRSVMPRTASKRTLSTTRYMSFIETFSLMTRNTLSLTMRILVSV